VRWVAARNIHLTLKFIGEIPDDRSPGVADVIRACAAEARPFSLAVKGVGAFPSLARPGVLFAQAADDPPVLARLAGRLNKKLAQFGAKRENRRFRPHLTIGRAKRGGNLSPLSGIMKQMADREFGNTRVEEIVFMMSDLTPQGPIYTPLGRMPLGRP